MEKKKINESDLFEPVKNYLTGLGYDVKGEVKDCDLAAVKEDELIVVELKKGFTMELIYQAIRRQAVADGVYVAVPLPKGGYNAPKYDDMVRLCKRLEIGLILVGFLTSGKPMVDVTVHPVPAQPVRKNKKKRLAVLTEHRGRSGEHDMGGVTRRKILTQYKEQALLIAKLLYDQGPLTTSALKQLGACAKTSSILQKNFYHWYEKAEERSYRITQAGLEALEEFADVL